MASRLRQSSARVSFFAFQDMITTVTGVMMIIMLLLSLEVGQRAAQAAAREAERPSVEQLAQARRQLALGIETLRQRQSELNALSNRIFVVREEDRSGRRPVLVALSATRACCSRLGQTNLVEFPFGTSDGAFRRLLEQFDPRTERLVFYVRPSGIAAFDACRALAETRGFTLGYDAAAEEKEYVLTAPATP